MLYAMRAPVPATRADLRAPDRWRAPERPFVVDVGANVGWCGGESGCDQSGGASPRRGPARATARRPPWRRAAPAGRALLVGEPEGECGCLGSAWARRQWRRRPRHLFLPARPRRFTLNAAAAGGKVAAFEGGPAVAACTAKQGVAFGRAKNGAAWALVEPAERPRKGALGVGPWLCASDRGRTLSVPAHPIARAAMASNVALVRASLCANPWLMDRVALYATGLGTKCAGRLAAPGRAAARVCAAGPERAGGGAPRAARARRARRPASAARAATLFPFGPAGGPCATSSATPPTRATATRFATRRADGWGRGGQRDARPSRGRGVTCSIDGRRLKERSCRVACRRDESRRPRRRWPGRAPPCAGPRRNHPRVEGRDRPGVRGAGGPAPLLIRFGRAAPPRRPRPMAERRGWGARAPQGWPARAASPRLGLPLRGAPFPNPQVRGAMTTMRLDGLIDEDVQVGRGGWGRKGGEEVAAARRAPGGFGACGQAGASRAGRLPGGCAGSHVTG
jgi:hypothetical protein